MIAKDLLGVWRLIDIVRSGGKGSLSTGQTHVVVQDDQLWAVWPNATYYEGESGPEHRYQFTAGATAKLQVFVDRGQYCYLVRREGSRLTLRLGDVFGYFPRHFDDDAGDLYLYELEAEPLASELQVPRPRLSRTTIQHDTLGDFVFDQELSWWTGRCTFDGQPTALNVECEDEPAVAPLDSAVVVLDRLDVDVIKRHASDELLVCCNEDWDGDHDAASFQNCLKPDAITVDSDGEVSVWFHDGGLFGGHSVVVHMDSALTPTDAEIAG